MEEITTISVDVEAGEEEEGWGIWTQTIIGILLGALFLMNIIGNSLTIAAFIKDKKLHSVQNIYIVNLAITDIVIGINSLPFYSVYTVLYYYWPFGYVFCKVWCVVDFWMCALSSLTIILISYDRLLMVQDGMKYNLQQTKERAAIKIAVCWILSFLLYGPAIIGYDKWRGYSTLEAGDCNVEFATEVIFTFITAFIEFMIPLVLLTTLNIKLYWNICKRTSQGTKNNDEAKTLSKDKKAAKALATLVIAYAICWTPYTVATIISAFCEDCVNEDVLEAFNWLLWSNSSINACLYAYTNERFRSHFKSWLCFICLKTNRNKVMSTSHITESYEQ